MKRILRIALTILISGAAVAYILTRIDIGKTLHIIGSASPGWLVLSAALTVVTVPPMSWRWQRLLAARGVHEHLPWLIRAYFVSYAVGQVLPTSVGGDASRIFETSRRHRGQITPITGSVLVERSLGGAVTLVLAGAGLLLAIGRYQIGAYVWIEALFVVLTLAAGVVFFSRSIRRRLAFALPYARRLRLETPARAVYDGIHGYRDHAGTLLGVAAVTLLLQLTRIMAIYASARAVGIGLSPLPYVVLGPLLFLVMLVPFTVNGLGVREAFFVSFLGNLGVSADSAFACGFLFFIMTLLLALPGVVLLVKENLFMRRQAVPMALPEPDVTVVVVTWNALPWLEQCLDSVRGHDVVVVDNGSTDGTVAFVRERFPEVAVVEQDNKGMGGGNNAGMRVARGRYFFLLNADAWVVGDALERLVEFADEHPRAAVVGPRLQNTDGTLQRSVRGEPTPWRLATEYLFIRKLAPRSQLLNPLYAGGFAHDEVREVESLYGPALLVRREAADAVGLFDEAFFMFSEEVDWLTRFRRAGWQVLFFPGAEVVHVGGAAHGGRLYIENLRGHLRWFDKHRGPRQAERVRRLLLVSLRLRALVWRHGPRGREAREGIRFLSSGSARTLLQ